MTNIKIQNLIASILIVLVLFSFTQIKEEKLKINIENLKGAYGGDVEIENAYFGIYEDSIYYPDSDIWVKYQLKKDTIITTNSENYIEKFLILKLTSDSLVLHDFNNDIEIPLNRRGK
nr:hypothetical protein [uncultured Carboxylicivirga sp.]